MGSSSVIRKCVVARLGEVTLSSYRNLMDQNAGALLILLPAELGNLSSELREVSHNPYTYIKMLALWNFRTL